jgi:hypothetical protein
MELYFHSPNTPPWRGAQLKYKDDFISLYFTLLYFTLLLYNGIKLKADLDGHAV